MEESTICALSTPVGTGGLAVIRISGPDAVSVANSVFRGRDLRKVPSHQAVHGFVVDPASGQKIDEVLVLPMRGSRTFTGEDTVEIDSHGGMYIVRRILEALLGAGAVMAERGEFSKRAFLNGKMDLNEAEAVMDMIDAKTSYSLQAAVSQMGGVLSEKIEKLRRQLLDMMVSMEVNIDYPEYDVPEITDEEIFRVIHIVRDEAVHLLKSADSGQLLRTGVKCALVGVPNVGKSSWLNLLLGQQRAIVTDIPGTTRDVLEEMLDLDGIPVRLVDTAGLRTTGDLVEKLGVERSYHSMEEADLILWVRDASAEPTDDDKEFLKKISHKPWLMLLNKMDLTGLEPETIVGKLAAYLAEDETDVQLMADRILPVSAKENTDLSRSKLSEKIKSMFFAGDVLDHGTPLITNLRQKKALQEAVLALERVMAAEGMPQDLLMIDIRQAYDALGSVNGLSSTEELVGEIFSRFCLGK